MFDVNVLIDENTVIAQENEALKRMEAHGIEPIIELTQYFWDGSIHCLTSDIVREGDCESYV